MACTAHTIATSCGGHIATLDCATHVVAVCDHVNDPACTAHIELGDSSPIGTITTWTDDPLTTSVKIKAIHHNELRNAITDELIRRSSSWPTDPGLVSASIKVNYLHVRRLRDGIDAAQTWSYPAWLNDSETEVGDKVLKNQYNSLRDQLNAYESGCPCDCNYACTCQCNYACTCQCNYACTCQCNYTCTCDCNYCTCNCNYCTCQCNYTCTCNCAYSDRRLKTEIIYM